MTHGRTDRQLNRQKLSRRKANGRTDRQLNGPNHGHRMENGQMDPERGFNTAAERQTDIGTDKGAVIERWTAYGPVIEQSNGWR